MSRSTPIFDRQLTQKEAAEILGVSERTIRNWVSTGELRAHRYGPRIVRIDPADLKKMRRPVTTISEW